MNKTIIFALILLLSGCSNYLIYTVEKPQGNYLSQSLIDTLKPGMNQDQVRFVMGSPMVTDTFSPERWDYLYFIDGNTDELKQVSLFFEDQKLSRIEGNLRPS